MYEDMTPEKIRGRILGRLKTDLQTREGSFTNDLIAAAAEELSEAYHSLDALIPAFYVDETSGPYIDKQAGTVGIVRKAGTKARCGVTFAGADGAAIPAGAVYYTASGLAFYLEAPVTLREGAGEGTLLAAEPGDAYNIAAGEIVTALLDLWSARDGALAQLCVETATWGLRYWEETLGIPVDEGKDLDTRRSRVRVKLLGSDVTTVALVKSSAGIWSGQKAEVTEHANEFRFEIRFVETNGVPPNMRDVTASIRELIPAHLQF